MQGKCIYRRVRDDTSARFEWGQAAVAVSERTISDLMAFEGEDFVDEAFILLLGRPVDPVGRHYYTERLRSGKSKAQVFLQISKSDESTLHQRKSPSLETAVAAWHARHSPLSEGLKSSKAVRRIRQMFGGATERRRTATQHDNQFAVLAEAQAGLNAELHAMRAILERIQDERSDVEFRVSQSHVQGMSWQTRVVYARLVEPEQTPENA